MKIHTNLTWAELEATLHHPNLINEVYFDGLEEHGSASRVRAFDVTLRAWESVNLRTGQKRRHPNTGTRGADHYEYAATYDEWGWFFARLYAADPTARCWAYASAEDFHDKTEGKYREEVQA